MAISVCSMALKSRLYSTRDDLGILLMMGISETQMARAAFVLGSRSDVKVCADGARTVGSSNSAHSVARRDLSAFRQCPHPSSAECSRPLPCQVLTRAAAHLRKTVAKTGYIGGEDEVELQAEVPASGLSIGEVGHHVDVEEVVVCSREHLADVLDAAADQRRPLPSCSVGSQAPLHWILGCPRP